MACTSGNTGTVAATMVNNVGTFIPASDGVPFIDYNGRPITGFDWWVEELHIEGNVLVTVGQTAASDKKQPSYLDVSFANTYDANGYSQGIPTFELDWNAAPPQITSWKIGVTVTYDYSGAVTVYFCIDPTSWDGCQPRVALYADVGIGETSGDISDWDSHSGGSLGSVKYTANVGPSILLTGSSEGGPTLNFELDNETDDEEWLIEPDPAVTLNGISNVTMVFRCAAPTGLNHNDESTDNFYCLFDNRSNASNDGLAICRRQDDAIIINKWGPSYQFVSLATIFPTTGGTDPTRVHTGDMVTLAVKWTSGSANFERSVNGSNFSTNTSSTVLSDNTVRGKIGSFALVDTLNASSGKWMYSYKGKIGVCVTYNCLLSNDDILAIHNDLVSRGL